MLIGVISDTHDLLRPEATRALDNVDEIIHVGDVCHGEILEELRQIAPLRNVLGNCDSGSWTDGMPLSDTFRLGEILVHACHIRERIDLDPLTTGISIVLNGHTHKPSLDEIGGVTYFNPGSAGPRRFSLPITLGFIEIDGARFETRWEHLSD